MSSRRTQTAPIARQRCPAGRAQSLPVRTGGYRRLFPHLPPLIADDAALHALGRDGGPCDRDAHFADEAESEIAAIWPFFGQFVAHDITADRSPIERPNSPTDIVNFRSPRADLEALYGAGPVGSPYLYSCDDTAKLLLGPSGHDVPRNQDGIALIGDARNDSHLFMTQMQVAFIHFHNRVVDQLRADGVDESQLFGPARRTVTWHFQYVLLHEFLPQLIGVGPTAALLAAGPSRYRVDEAEPYIPVEFADAAYRYGHAQIRRRYQVNSSLGPLPIFPDLMGFRPVPPERAIDWSLQIDVPGRPPAQRSHRIGTSLPRFLLDLPTRISGARYGDEYASLATRDLQRGLLAGLPSGEAIARELGYAPLTRDEIGIASHGWRHETPLWLYILKEAEALEDGERLGPVGGRIVGEVLVGIVDADPESFRSVEPDWKPRLLAMNGVFGLADILVPPAMNSTSVFGIA